MKERPKHMYGMRLYIPFEEINDYVHNHTEENYEDLTFIPIKAEVNVLSSEIEISLVSAVPNEFYDTRIKLELDQSQKENQNV